MSLSHKTAAETIDLADRQFLSLEQGLAKGHFDLELIGDLMPGSVMVHDMAALRVSYMNNWGCQQLYHSLEEIKDMGAGFFDRFLVAEETHRIIPELTAYFQEGSNTGPYGFFQQVRSGPRQELSWHYTSCKFLRDTTGQQSTQLILASNPVSGLGLMVNKVTKLLEENVYVARNYKKFMQLTRREKEIIGLLAEGKTTKDISGLLFLSHHTVSTHRKNISNKLQINSFSGLLKFASAFELIR